MKQMKRFLQLTWSGVTTARVIFFNVLFLIVIVFLLGLWLADNTPVVPSRAALVWRPVGVIVDQLAGDPEQQAIDRLTGSAQKQTLTKDLLDAIEIAATDERIEVLFLDLNGLGGGGLTKLQQLGRAIKDFRDNGKKVIAAADNYTQAGYYLARPR